MNVTAEDIKLILEEGTFEEDFKDSMHYAIDLYLNETYIGYIDGNAGDDYIHIELIHIDNEYRDKGYGSIALENLKNIGRTLGIKAIDGECSSRLINFYTRLGAKFECREEIDHTYILNKFYIDL